LLRETGADRKAADGFALDPRRCQFPGWPVRIGATGNPTGLAVAVNRKE
jgi:hypothetical protein